jgi:hypothetical protein
VRQLQHSSHGLAEGLGVCMGIKIHECYFSTAILSDDELDELA